MDSILRQISHDKYLFNIDDYMPSAWIGHAPFLKFLIRELKPSVFVELGVQHGFSYFVGCQSILECQLKSRAFAIDHWLGDPQAGFNDESVYKNVEALNNKYLGFSTLLKMSFDEARDRFEDHSIDLLHIDGYHSYESVKHDFNSWLIKMSINSIILLHDIHVRRDTFGVYLFWKELKENYRTIEFVGSHGLGVVFLGEVPKGTITHLVEMSERGELPQVQGTFGSIADDVIQYSRNFLSDRAIAERDRAIAERDRAIAERDRVLNSRIWRISTFYRWIRNLLKY